QMKRRGQETEDRSQESGIKGQRLVLSRGAASDGSQGWSAAEGKRNPWKPCEYQRSPGRATETWAEGFRRPSRARAFFLPHSRGCARVTRSPWLPSDAPPGLRKRRSDS